MARRELDAKEIEAGRKRFATFMRTYKSHDVLRRLSAAGDWAYDEVSVRGLDFADSAVEKALARENLAGYHIRGTRISYNQLMIVYEMVKNGKYGGIDGKGSNMAHTALSSLNLSDRATLANQPDGYFPLCEGDPSRHNVGTIEESDERLETLATIGD